MPENNLKYQIAITLLPGIGDIVGRKLISYCGGVEAVFKENKSALQKIPGIGSFIVSSITTTEVLERVEKEMEFINRNSVNPIFYTDPAYPARLNNCEDGPMMLYYKGTANLNSKRILSIVGTRRPTSYGKTITKKLVSDLKSKGITVVSGLAYGIDSIAHSSCLEEDVETIGVLGHGLDRIYPAQNRSLSVKMLQKGGLLTEFMSGTLPDRENFPKRNRIVAGMSDAVIVVESAARGGALITAQLANSYNRDVFAIPGKIEDEYSIGCNRLIKTNRAALAESADDIAYIMGWDDTKPSVKSQRNMFYELNDDQKTVYEMIEESEQISIDAIIIKTNFPSSKVSTILLELEFEGLIQSMPGKRYSIFR